MPRIRLTKEKRREDLLTIAVEIATSPRCTYRSITRDDLAKKADCSPGLISHIFGDMNGLRRAVIEYGRVNKIKEIRAQAKIFGD